MLSVYKEKIMADISLISQTGDMFIFRKINRTRKDGLSGYL